jgi:hypothetical protein
VTFEGIKNLEFEDHALLIQILDEVGGSTHHCVSTDYLCIWLNHPDSTEFPNSTKFYDRFLVRFEDGKLRLQYHPPLRDHLGNTSEAWKCRQWLPVHEFWLADPQFFEQLRAFLLTSYQDSAQYAEASRRWWYHQDKRAESLV